MPDWQGFVGEHLAALALDAKEREEIVEELAAHLDEVFVGVRKQGFSEEHAISCCLQQVRDWHSLGRDLQSARKEDGMTNRVTQLWLPGLLTFTLSMIFLALTEILGPKPWTTWGHNPPLALFYIPWLLSLPFVGALGAYLSHRAGGSRRAILLSTVFSILPFLATLLMVIPFSLALDHVVPHNIQPAAFLVFLLGWVCIPGVALLVGGLPVQLVLTRRFGAGRPTS